VTDYLRQCRKIRDTFYPDVTFGLFAMQPKYAGSHMGLEEGKRVAHFPEDPFANLEDHETWISEKLVGTYTIGHNCGSRPDALETVEDQIGMAKGRLGNTVKFNLEVETYTDREDRAETWLGSIVSIAQREGIDELLLRESCPMWRQRNMWQAIKELSGT